MEKFPPLSGKSHVPLLWEDFSHCRAHPDNTELLLILFFPNECPQLPFASSSQAAFQDTWKQAAWLMAEKPLLPHSIWPCLSTKSNANLLSSDVQATRPLPGCPHFNLSQKFRAIMWVPPWASNCSISVEQGKVSCDLCTCGSPSQLDLQWEQKAGVRGETCDKEPANRQPGVLVCLSPSRFPENWGPQTGEGYLISWFPKAKLRA